GGLVRRAADDRVGADRRTRLGGRGVLLPDVHAVGAARRDEIGPVVEDEQRAALVGGGPELARRGDQALVVERLVAQLDDVDAAADRCGEELARPGVADEVQPSAGDPFARGHPALSLAPIAVYTGRSTTGARNRAERAAPGRRPSN